MAGASGAAATTCYRDPLLPDHYAAPCDQPEARAACNDGFCTIEPGCFIMGSPWCEWGRAKFATDPVQVTLTHRFEIADHERTQGEWKQLGLPNPSGRMADETGDCLNDDCPVGNVTWFEALEYANRLSADNDLPKCYELTGCTGEMGRGMLCDAVRFATASIYDCKGYRLPTGAEWEYAARAGTTTTVYTGDILEMGRLMYTCYNEPVLDDIAWYCDNAGPYTHPVRQKQPNGWGLYDVIGNAGEWVGSLGPYGYGEGPFVDYGAVLDVKGLVTELSAPVQWRGGLWIGWPHIMRAGMAPADPAEGKGPGLGLRIARTLFGSTD